MLRLVGAGGSIEEFQWSEDEQVWPFEKRPDGSTLYCKYIDFGPLPNTVMSTVAHGVSNIDLFDIKANCYYPDKSFQDNREPLPIVHSSFVTSQVNLSVNDTNVRMECSSNRSAQAGLIRIIYAKTS